MAKTATILGLSLLFLIVSAFIIGFVSTPLSIFGFTTLSLSQIDVQSGDPILGGQVWALTVRAGGLGQYATGASKTFSESEISTDEGKAANQLDIKIVSQSQSCEYPIAHDQNAFGVYT